jgi:hypothetical protein
MRADASAGLRSSGQQDELIYCATISALVSVLGLLLLREQRKNPVMAPDPVGTV